MYVVVGVAVLAALVVAGTMLSFICKGRRQQQHLASLEGKHVLITNGSRGIGLALAKECLSQGASVSLLVPNQPRLSDAASTLILPSFSAQEDRIFLKAVDAADSNAVSAAISECSQWKPIDVLICNAAGIVAGLFGHVDVEHMDLVTMTNFLGYAYPVHAALPLMKARSEHHPCSILFVSTLTSLMFSAGLNIYGATKYAVKGLAETLRFELMPYHNIKVSVVCHGFVQSSMLDEVDKAEVLASNIMSKIQFYVRLKAQAVDAVARKAVEGVKHGDFLITTNVVGFMVGVLGRGFVPSDSLIQASVELFLLVPVRVASFVWYAYARWVLRRMQYTHPANNKG